MSHEIESKVLGRRAFLATSCALGVAGTAHALGASSAAVATSGLARVAGSGTPPGSIARTATELLARNCILTPAETAGPYYLPIGLERRHLSPGLAGLPLTIFMRVVRASDCTPVVDAAVDVWHTDVAGDYSGIAALGTTGTTFGRGYQRTSASGVVRFETIYPGWYPARTTHIHLRVFPGGGVLFTTQLYLPDHVSDNVYRLAPYVARGPKPHANSADAYFHAENVFSVRSISTASLFGAVPTPRATHLYAGLTIGLA